MATECKLWDYWRFNTATPAFTPLSRVLNGYADVTFRDLFALP